ncbi:MAG TPA: alpha/beta hydrolase [Candidatus Acidoferrales bacterium]|nr:alpha/beta hydrolase [Candidatus Acidoferrales bacterium]
MNFRSNDAELYFQVIGRGPELIFLHPFPSSHEFWLQVAQLLMEEYRCVMPDLRGLGQSQPGDGPATMPKHAEDLECLCRHLGVGKAVFIGCSIGGYVLFEFWRRHRERFNGLVLADTKSPADTETERANRLKLADRAENEGPSAVVETMLPKLLAESTQRNRPDIVSAARQTMARSTAKGLAANLRGMAEREDSTATLTGITVPTLVIGGQEDVPSPRAELERLTKGIHGAELRLIDHAGHFAAFEQPDAFARALRLFLHSNAR